MSPPFSLVFSPTVTYLFEKYRSPLAWNLQYLNRAYRTSLESYVNLPSFSSEEEVEEEVAEEEAEEESK